MGSLIVAPISEYGIIYSKENFANLTLFDKKMSEMVIYKSPPIVFRHVLITTNFLYNVRNLIYKHLIIYTLYIAYFFISYFIKIL